MLRKFVIIKNQKSVMKSSKEIFKLNFFTSSKWKTKSLDDGYIFFATATADVQCNHS